jgi:hypothetical protein
MSEPGCHCVQNSLLFAEAKLSLERRSLHSKNCNAAAVSNRGIRIIQCLAPNTVDLYSSSPKLSKTDPHHGHNSLINPPLPNRLPRSRFLSDLGRSSGKIYLPPLTNASITCESPSSRRRHLEIDHRTKSTSILFLCHPLDQIASPEVNSCPFWTGQVAKSIYRP